MGIHRLTFYEDMSPEKRWQRIVELLAIASVRLAVEQGILPSAADSGIKNDLVSGRKEGKD
jgi:hypothetical protein